MNKVPLFLWIISVFSLYSAFLFSFLYFSCLSKPKQPTCPLHPLLFSTLFLRAQHISDSLARPQQGKRCYFYFNYVCQKNHNVTVLNLNRNSLPKCNYCCPQITPVFLRHKTEHSPDAKMIPALPVLSIKKKSLGKKSALIHPCLWVRSLKVTALLQPFLNAQTDHSQLFPLFIVSRTYEEEVTV